MSFRCLLNILPGVNLIGHKFRLIEKARSSADYVILVNLGPLGRISTVNSITHFNPFKSVKFSLGLDTPEIVDCLINTSDVKLGSKNVYCKFNLLSLTFDPSKNTADSAQLDHFV